MPIAIDSLSDSRPKPGDTVTANLSGASAGGKTATYGAISLTVDSQSATTIVFTWPDLQSFGSPPSLEFRTSLILLVTDGGNDDSKLVVTLPRTGYNVFTIDGFSQGNQDSIYNDDGGVLDGDQHCGHVTAGTVGVVNADGTLGDYTHGATYEYWLYQQSASQWYGPAVETLNISSATSATPGRGGIAGRGRGGGLLR